MCRCRKLTMSYTRTCSFRECLCFIVCHMHFRRNESTGCKSCWYYYQSGILYYKNLWIITLAMTSRAPYFNTVWYYGEFVIITMSPLCSFCKIVAQSDSDNLLWYKRYTERKRNSVKQNTKLEAQINKRCLKKDYKTIH